MTTALVLSNRNMLVNLDEQMQLKDLYYPHIGQDNQLNRYLNRMFLWVNGRIYHLNSDNCGISYDYQDDLNIAAARIFVREPGLEIKLTDYILPEHDIYMREFELINQSKSELQLKLFFQNNFALNESEYADTVVWYQPAGCLMHYKKDCYLGIGSCNELYQLACAAKSDASGLGAFPDADGELKYNPVSTGNVNSCISFKYNLQPGEKQQGHMFIAAATDPDTLTQAVKFLRDTPLLELAEQTRKYWRALEERITSVLPLAKLDKLNDQDFARKLRRNLNRSAMILLTQIDNNGAVLAANDGLYLKTGGNDTYSYFWPRDAANTVMALCELGLRKEAQQCLNYALKLSGRKGYFLHKYFPVLNQDKPTLGSSWHTWTDPSGKSQLPIQEDATALMVLAVSAYYLKFHDNDFLKSNWNGIEAMLKFLKSFNYLNFHGIGDISQYVNGLQLNGDYEFSPASALPYPSFDIWEQYWGVFSFTAITILEALKAGTHLVDAVKAKYLKENLIKYYKTLKQEVLGKLVIENRFLKGVRFEEHQNLMLRDSQPDSSLIFAATITSDAEIQSLLSTTLPGIISGLSLVTVSGGLARKLEDRYLRIDESYPGNPWFLNSLWLAETEIASGDLEKAEATLGWVLRHTDDTGLMSEQLDPYTGFSLGIKPLTWSHAEFIKASCAYLKALP